ncbi:uncharacterized protein LOC111246605 isoform X4 [Varroa destructor]|nr:uncharacterized protein LOC111246605 isoform X4 [Varroa destructor]
MIYPLMSSKPAERQTLTLKQRINVYSLECIGSSSNHANLPLHYTGNCYITLPEIPDDTAETNSLLRVTDKVPQYNDITAESAFRAVGKLFIEYESGLCQIEEQLEDPNHPKTFKSVFEPIEKLLSPMESAWMSVRNLLLVRNDNDIAKAYEKLHRRAEQANARRFNSSQIYRVVKDFHDDLEKFDDDQQQVIRKYCTSFKLMGLDLDYNNKQILKETADTIRRQGATFENKLAQATNAFKQPLDGDIIKTFPENLRQHFSTQNGFLVTLHEPQYSAFMAYCSDRRHRQNLYTAASIRASFTNMAWNNSIHIEEIRCARKQEARAFGYKTYAEKATATKMAPSVEHIVKTLIDLSKKIDPVAKEHIRGLQAFCAEKGFKATLERWDLPYWRRRYRQAHLAIDENDMRQLFPLEAVLQGLCNFVEKFFGIEMREVQSKEPLWAPDVKMFEVAVDSAMVGTILMDLPTRGDKYPGSWCQRLKTRCVTTNTSPLVSIVMNLHDRTSVSLSELSDLLKNLGHALQHTVSRARYIDVSGIANLPWDIGHMVPDLFDMLLLDKRFAQMLSAEEALTDEYHSKIVDSRLHMGAVDLQHEIYLSLLDLELYSSDDYWQDVVNRLRPHLITAFPKHQHDVFHVCSFSEIISGPLAAGYYSKIWSRMIAAEVFHAMHECQDDADIAKVARRFRDVMLVDGGCVPPIEAFRRFRGRDPAPDSLQSVCKLQELSVKRTENTKS